MTLRSAEVEDSPGGGGAPVTGGRARPGRLVGLAVALAALGVFLTGLGRPALWLDEATTVDAVTRGWGDLLRLLRVREGPLAPYYLLLKPWAAVSVEAWWLRLPSALAVAAAAGLLAAVVTRRAGRAAGVAGGLVFALLPYVSRYAQEARPYAFLLLGLALTAAAWDSLDRPSLTRGPQVRRAAALALAVAFSLSMNVMAGVSVVALVLARALDVRPGWWGRLLPTAAGSLGGLVLASPAVYLAVTGAFGVTHPPGVGLRSLWGATLTLLGPLPVLVLGVPLGVVGLWRLRDAAARPVVLLALCWALVPPFLLAAATPLEPSLAIPRYWLVAAPGCALLAGIGCAVVGNRLAGLVGRESGPAGPAARAVGTALPLLLLAVASFPQHERIRAADGHEGEDPRPVLALLQTPAYRDLAVVGVPRDVRFAVVAYAPDLLDRMVLARDPVPSGQLVVDDLPPRQARAVLADEDEVAVLVFRQLEAVEEEEALTGLTEVSRTVHGGWAVLRMERTAVGPG